MQKELEKIGFTQNEARVYVALLDLGESPTGPLIKKTGLHRNIVYESLDQLARKRLVRETVQKGKKCFAILDAEPLIHAAEAELETAKMIVEEVRKKATVQAPRVMVYEGQDGWQTAYRRVFKHLHRGDQIVAFGAGADRWVNAMGDLFIPYERFCREYKIQYHMIAYEWQREELEAHQSNLLTKIRYLPEKIILPANTEIFPDRVFIQIYSDPVVLIEIVSKEVTEGYLQHFQSLWKVAKA